MAARKTQPAPAPAEPEEQTPPADEPGEDAPAEQAPPRSPGEEAHIEALHRERAGYVRYGRDDRAEEVAAELLRLGASLERAVPAARETA